MEEKEQAVAVKPYVFNQSVFLDKAKALQADIAKRAGEKNFNPFLWEKENLTPLILKFKRGERSKDLFDAMMALPKTVPCIDPDYVPEPEPVVFKQGVPVVNLKKK